MDQNYTVTVCGKQAGKVVVQRQGLYYHIHCRCCLAGDIMYRLVVNCGSIRESLGILVPEGGSFVLDTRLPVKRIGEGKLAFALIPKHEISSGSFVPIRPEEPFSYIARLKESFLILRDGQPGILIHERQA